MKKIEIGTVFYVDNDEIERIYENYPDFFKVSREYGLEYTLIKEPSSELMSEIEGYYELRREWNHKYNEFVTVVATEIVEAMSDEVKALIYDNPDSTTHHFGMGLGIRNKYIHSKDFDFPIGHPDDLSANITARVASLIIDNFDYSSRYYQCLYRNIQFCHERKLYKAITGEYPDKILKKYENDPEYIEGVKKAQKEIKETVINAGRFKRLCGEYGISEERYKEFKKLVDDYNQKNWSIVPYDIGLLESFSLEPKVRNRLLEVLKAVVNKQNYFEIPEYVFNQKDAALIAVSESGGRLEFCKNFSDDHEVILAALTNDARAIEYVDEKVRYKEEYVKLALSNDKYGEVLELDCMSGYRDMDKYVLMALEANGRSIQWASDRIRDDFDMASFAVRHQGDYYPEDTICNLSDRLRDNIDLAIIDINEGHACVDDYSDRLKDSDEVAKVLLSSEHAWKIYMMSDRIKEIYDR